MEARSWLRHAHLRNSPESECSVNYGSINVTETGVLLITDTTDTVWVFLFLYSCLGSYQNVHKSMANKTNRSKNILFRKVIEVLCDRKVWYKDVGLGFFENSFTNWLFTLQKTAIFTEFVRVNVRINHVNEGLSSKKLDQCKCQYYYYYYYFFFFVIVCEIHSTHSHFHTLWIL